MQAPFRTLFILVSSEAKHNSYIFGVPAYVGMIHSHMSHNQNPGDWRVARHLRATNEGHNNVSPVRMFGANLGSWRINMGRLGCVCFFLFLFFFSLKKGYP